VYGAIATEQDAKTLDELKVFLQSHNHPVTKRWEQDNPAGAGDMPVERQEVSVLSGRDIPFTAGGFRIILKNAKITAEKVIIQPIRPGGERHGTQKP
jgi:acetyl-CoA decarbonylase/synthase complex subunit beta